MIIIVDEYRKDLNFWMGNLLIDEYGENDFMKIGEMGRGVIFVGKEKVEVIKKL